MIKVVYWSGTGNTKAVAELIEAGIKTNTQDVQLVEVANTTVEETITADLLVLGASANGKELLDQKQMEPFVEGLKDVVKGKKVALFGSYGWGSGKWMESWKERMESYGAEVVDTLIINGAPADEYKEVSVEFGKSISK